MPGFFLLVEDSQHSSHVGMKGRHMCCSDGKILIIEGQSYRQWQETTFGLHALRGIQKADILRRDVEMQS